MALISDCNDNTVLKRIPIKDIIEEKIGEISDGCGLFV